MDRTSTWSSTLEGLRRKGYQVASLDADAALAAIEQWNVGPVPMPLLSFAHRWLEPTSTPWHAFVAGVATAHPAPTSTWLPLAMEQGLRPTLERAEHAAVVWGDQEGRRSPDKWSLLLQVPSREPSRGRSHLCLHVPAIGAAIAAAEQVLGVTLPPGYQQFLQLTNGLGLDADETIAIMGAGPTRAEWQTVVANEWLQCEDYNEVTARWRLFQGVSAFERARDAREGVHSFAADEKRLVPFYTTFFGDDWCFDTASQAADGEYAIVFWDHETRDAYPEYASFSAWLTERLELELFGD